jgi:vacuolar-type H+-ATPase subunit H
MARLGTAEYGYRGAVESAREQGAAARDVADIQGRYGVDANRYSQDAETLRTREGLASAERQIGLTGSETRRTVETQGEQSRRNIVTEGEQSRENIRTTGDEQRRSLAYDRANAAKTAISYSRRG